MKKTAAVIGLLVGLSALGIWFTTQEPTNEDGYKYEDYFHTAAMTSDQGTLSFMDTRLDTITIVRPPMLPFDYVMKVTTGKVLQTGLVPSQFYSVYKFPDGKWEAREGTEPE